MSTPPRARSTDRSPLSPAEARAALRSASRQPDTPCPQAAPAADGGARAHGHKRAPRCLVMGIVNVTPDSFSDGGQFLEPAAALEHAQTLLDQGADMVDIGGQSTRPGAGDVTPAQEWQRVGPVVEALVAQGAIVSVDTMWAATAARALAAGAHLINDVSGGLADPEMAATVAASDATYIAMHWRGHAGVMDSLAHYDDVTREVCAHLTQRVLALQAAGVSPDRLVLDPGLGFAKDAGHNWELLRHVGDIQQLGYPVLIGASRKRFLADVGPSDAAAQDRDDATTALTALVAERGVWAVRVHDTAAAAAAVRVARRMALPR